MDDDQRRISTLNLLSDAERAQLLVGFNATQAPYPEDLCIQRLFERQAARTPDAIAVVFEGTQLHYGELNAQANQGSSLGLKTLPVQVRPAGLPSTHRSKRPAIKALPKTLRARKTRRPVLSAQKPRTVIYPPREPASQTPAPIRDTAATSSTSATGAPSGQAASLGIADAPVLGKAAPPPNAPAASALAPSAIGQGLTAKGNRSGSPTKVASVGLPAGEKGLVIPKMPVGPISPKIEIVPRPAAKVKNCGDDKVFIACPVLHDRYETPYTSPAP